MAIHAPSPLRIRHRTTLKIITPKENIAIEKGRFFLPMFSRLQHFQPTASRSLNEPTRVPTTSKKKVRNMSTSSFAAPDMPTMHDALTNLDTQTHIPARKRRRWRQDALAACKWFGFKPEDLIANFANLNPRFRRLPRGTLGKRGVTKKRVSNVKHSVKCLVACLPSQNNRSFKAELSPPWSRLAAVMPNRYRLTSVHCIMKFCSAQDILPAEFDDEASARLLAALVAERLNGNPPITHQNAVRSSNWLKVGPRCLEWVAA